MHKLHWDCRHLNELRRKHENPGTHNKPPPLQPQLQLEDHSASIHNLVHIKCKLRTLGEDRLLVCQLLQHTGGEGESVTALAD